MPKRLKRFQSVLFSSLFGASLVFAQQLPHTGARTLTGKRIEVPSAFSGITTILIVSYTTSSLQQSKLWAKELPADHYIIYLQPEHVPFLLKEFTLFYFRRRIPLQQQLRFIIVPYTTPWSFLDTPWVTDDTSVVVLTRSGELCWKLSDRFSAEGKAAVMEAFRYCSAHSQ